MEGTKKGKNIWKVFLLIAVPVLIAIPAILAVVFSIYEVQKPAERQDVWENLPRTSIPYDRYALRIGGDDWIETLAFDTDGLLWVGTDYGICVFDEEMCSSLFLPGEFVNEITVDPVGNVWAGTEVGVKVYDGEVWTVYNTGNSGLSDNSVRAIAFDRQNHSWIGTFNGLNLFDGEHWTTFNTSNSAIPDNFITKIVIGPDGKVWVGTFGGGLAVLEYQTPVDSAPERFEIIETFSFYEQGIDSLSLSDDERTAGEEYNEAIETLTFGQGTGLLSSSDNIEDILFDREGRAYIATWGYLFINDGIGWVSAGVQSSHVGTILYALEMDSKGRLWIGGSGFSPGSMWIYTLGGSGLAILDGQELYIFHDSISSFMAPRVNDIVIDDQGFVWLGTTDGLFKIAEDIPLPISSSAVDNLEQANQAEQQQFREKGDKRLLIYPLGLGWLVIFTVTISIGLHRKQSLANKIHKWAGIVVPSLLGLITFGVVCFFGFVLGLGVHYATEIQFFFLLIAFPWFLGLGVGLVIRWILIKILKERPKILD